MAVMALQNGAIWGSSASLLEFVAGKLKESGYFSRFEKNFDAIEAGWQHLDFSDLNEDEQSKFRMVVRSVINEVKSAPADYSGKPRYSAGFIATLEELGRLVAGNNSK
jgi:hypothetical protein